MSNEIELEVAKCVRALISEFASIADMIDGLEYVRDEGWGYRVIIRLGDKKIEIAAKSIEELLLSIEEWFLIYKKFSTTE
jgi:hypothetical protein